MRMTRAQLRAQAQEEEMREQHKDLLIHEDNSETENATNFSSPNNAARPALRDITDDNYPQADLNTNTEIEQSSTKTQAKAKSKSTKKKAECISATPPPDEAELVKESLDKVQGAELVHEEAEQEQVQVGTSEQLETEVAAVQTPAEPTSERPASETPVFNPDIHMATEIMVEPATEDSFVDSITSRSPAKLIKDTIAQLTGDKSEDKGSQKSSRRASNRIEDSVEEMDALEDAIEKFTEDLPVLSPKHTAVGDNPRLNTPSIQQNISAVRTPRTLSKNKVAASPMPKSIAKEKTKTPARPTPAINSSTTQKRSSPVKSVNPVKNQKPSPVSSGNSAKVVRPSVATGNLHSKNLKSQSKPTSRPTTFTRVSTVSKPREVVSKPDMSSSNTSAKQQPNAVKKRSTSNGILSTSKPGFVPAKSAKPPTTSTFSLPGDVIAAKLKAQREERLKREEEAAQEKPKQFKARPAPNMSSRPSTLPRENKASQARLSMMTSGSDKENVAPRPSTSGPSRNIGKARVATSTTDSKPNSSIRRTTQAGPSSTNNQVGPSSTRVSSLSNGQRSMVTKEDSAIQKVGGKEVFGRIKANVDQQMKERKEKEEAARKARAEAAERGRQASREWAEKQKKRMTDATSQKATANVMAA